jgi:hypothetical protein
MINHFFEFISLYVNATVANEVAKTKIWKNQPKPLNLYAHNASKFDLVFLLKHLIKFVDDPQKVSFLTRDGKFLAID